MATSAKPELASSPDVLWKNGRFGATSRRDNWWVSPLLVFLGFGTFLIYANWAAFQNKNYTFGPYLSPFYSPELFGDSPHAWFGPKPGWYPSFLPFSPALFILWIPGLFRFTCYYYRGAYYKAFWADPPACAVGEPRKSYLGERSFPLIATVASLFSAAVLYHLGHPGLRCHRILPVPERFRNRGRKHRVDRECDPSCLLYLRLPCVQAFDWRVYRPNLTASGPAPYVRLRELLEWEP